MQLWQQPNSFRQDVWHLPRQAGGGGDKLSWRLRGKGCCLVDIKTCINPLVRWTRSQPLPMMLKLPSWVLLSQAFPSSWCSTCASGLGSGLLLQNSMEWRIWVLTTWHSWSVLDLSSLLRWNKICQFNENRIKHKITKHKNVTQVMDNLTDKSKRSMIYPFHKEGWKTMSGHLVISWLVFKKIKHYWLCRVDSLKPK